MGFKFSSISQITDDFYSQKFYAIGLFVADYYRCVIGFTVVISLALSSGLHRINPRSSLFENYNAIITITNYDCSPFGSASRVEHANIERFWSHQGQMFLLSMRITARGADGGKANNVLRPDRAQQALDVIRNVQRTVSISDGKTVITFEDLCHAFCDTTRPVEEFLNAKLNTDAKDQKKGLFKPTFPRMTFLGKKQYIGYNFLAAVTEPNGIRKNERQLISADAIFLRFRTTFTTPRFKQLVNAWERQAFAYFESVNRDPNSTIHVSYSTKGLAAEGAKRNTRVVLPYLPLTIGLMIVFSLLSTLRREWCECRPVEVLLGVVCPGLAVGSSFGLLLYLDVTYVPANSVVPFLILAIGVDDMFITLHHWHRTDVRLPARERIGRMLAGVGPSITITSLTNLLAFAVGAFTPTPAMRYFCIYIAVACAFDYLYQLLFFTAVLYIGGRREERARHNRIASAASFHIALETVNGDLRDAAAPKATSCCGAKAEASSSSDLVVVRPVDRSDSTTDSSPRQRPVVGCYVRACDRLLAAVAMFGRLWIRLILCWPARLVVLMVVSVYLAVAVKGITNAEVMLNEKQLFLEDSPQYEYNANAGQYEWLYANELFVLFNEPLDLRNDSVRDRIDSLRSDLESLPESVGADSTQYWLPHYMRYVSFVSKRGADFTYAHLPAWLLTRNAAHWSLLLKLNKAACLLNRVDCVQQFLITTQFGGMRSISDWVQVVPRRRLLLANYTDLAVSCFDHFGLFADQILIIRSVCVSTVLAAIVCMFFVCVCFMPQLMTIATAMLCVFSINTGTFGLLMLWNTNLDPVSTATIVIAIGFSVDFTTHISYHYYRTKRTMDVAARLQTTLAGIAYPMVQAGLSTILAVLTLAGVPSYMVRTFVKTVVLVILLGITHALLVLPMLLVTVTQLKQQFCQRWSAESIKPADTDDGRH